MNKRQLENRIHHGSTRVKQDVSDLVEDSTVQLSNLENKVVQATSQAKENLTTLVEDGASQLSDGLGKIVSDTRNALDNAATTVSKDVGHGLNQYNAEAQKIADKVLGGFAKKITSHPWVAISIGLMFGFLLGGLLKLPRKIPG